MNQEQFQTVIGQMVSVCTKTLAHKNAEYNQGEDKLTSFKDAAAIDDESPAKALWGMYKKHLISVRDIVADTNAGRRNRREVVQEKIKDSIVYHLLLWALLEEFGFEEEDGPEEVPKSKIYWRDPLELARKDIDQVINGGDVKLQ